MMRCLAILALASGGGCSFLTVEPSTSGHQPSDRPACTSSRVAPTADVAVAAAAVFGAVGVGLAGWMSADANNEDEDSFTAAIPPIVVTTGAITAVVTGASARWGFRKTNRCRAERTRVR